MSNNQNLYHWNRSEAFRNYAPGDIIVMAEGLDQAKDLVRAEFEDYLRERYEYYFDTYGDIPNPNNQQELITYRDVLEMDLATDPIIVTPTVIFIWGSE